MQKLGDRLPPVPFGTNRPKDAASPLAGQGGEDCGAAVAATIGGRVGVV